MAQLTHDRAAVTDPWACLQQGLGMTTEARDSTDQETCDVGAELDNIAIRLYYGLETSLHDEHV